MLIAHLLLLSHSMSHMFVVITLTVSNIECGQILRSFSMFHFLCNYSKLSLVNCDVLWQIRHKIVTFVFFCKNN